ncbi:MAG: hypothetical protein ACXW2F_01715 [Thermoanaerobaculia bacterium]
MKDTETCVVRSLERVTIRLRDSTFAQAAWRMIIDSESGDGAITLVEGPGGGFFRGEGIFLGRPQHELRATYERLNKPAAEPDFDLPQLG